MQRSNQRKFANKHQPKEMVSDDYSNAVELQKQGRYEEAIALYERCSNLLSVVKTAQCYFKLNQLHKAITYLQNAANLSERHDKERLCEEICKIISIDYVKNGNTSYFEAFKKALDDHPNKKSHFYQFQLANYKINIDQLDQAATIIQALKKNLRLPKDSFLMVNALTLELVIIKKSGENLTESKAKKILNEISQTTTSNVSPLLTLAECFPDLINNQKPFPLVSDNSFESQIDKALLYEGLKRYTDAEMIYEILLKTNPTHWKCRRLYAALLFHQAISDHTTFNEVIKQVSVILDAKNNLEIKNKPSKKDYLVAYTLLGNSMLHKGNLTLARTYLREGLAIDPDYAALNSLEGKLTTQNSEKSRGSFSKAIKNDPRRLDKHVLNSPSPKITQEDSPSDNQIRNENISAFKKDTTKKIKSELIGGKLAKTQSANFTKEPLSPRARHADPIRFEKNHSEPQLLEPKVASQQALTNEQPTNSNTLSVNTQKTTEESNKSNLESFDLWEYECSKDESDKTNKTEEKAETTEINEDVKIKLEIPDSWEEIPLENSEVSENSEFLEVSEIFEINEEAPTINSEVKYSVVQETSENPLTPINANEKNEKDESMICKFGLFAATAVVTTAVVVAATICTLSRLDGNR